VNILTLFGLFAVTAMLVTYALESRSTWFILAFAAACALGYLDFRFAAQPWRPARAKLATWFDAFVRNPGIADTVPKDPA